MKHSQRGYAVPLALMVSSVTLFLGFAVSQLSHGDLTLANRHYFQARAQQMCEVGFRMRSAGQPGNLENDSIELDPDATTPIVYGYFLPAGGNSTDRVYVTVYDNSTGELPASAGSPTIPPVGCQYWVAEGQALEGGKIVGRYRVGAVVRRGAPVGSAGAMLSWFNPPLFPSLGGSPPPLVSYSAYNPNQPGEGYVHNETVVHSDAAELRWGPPAPGGPTPVPGAGNPGNVGLATVTAPGSPPVAPNIKIPTAADPNLVTYVAGSPVAPRVSATGGQFNPPVYTPPSALTEHGSNTPSDGQTLNPGHYSDLRLHPGVNVNLSPGTYHFSDLVLEGTDEVTAHLTGPESGRVKIYVDKVTATSNVDTIKLTNRQRSAANFELQFQPHTEAGEPPNLPILEMAYPDEEPRAYGVKVIASGRALRLRSDSNTNDIRGAFMCKMLTPEFLGLGAAEFAFDTTANPHRIRENEERSLFVVGESPPADFYSFQILNRQPL